MNLRNIAISMVIISAVLGNSVIIAGVPSISSPDLPKLATMVMMGAAGVGAGLVLGAQKGKVIGIAHEEKLGSQAETIGRIGGGVAGMVAGGVAGAAVGFVIVKAIYAAKGK
jgi:hypothetical protein